MKEGKYLYGVINTNGTESFDFRGINDDEEVYTISHLDVACVVSNSPVLDYTTMLKEELGRLLVKHQRTVEKIMKGHTVIPMKFGTFLSDDGEVKETLKRGYFQLKELLSSMDGKIEFNVTSMWGDLNGIVKEMAEEDEEIKKFKEEIAGKPSDQSLQDRIKIGMMIKDLLDERREKEEAHTIDSLKNGTIDFQKHQVMNDEMISNCAFLLEKDEEVDFDAALKKLNEEYNEKVNFRCIGPLPPYSFATCQLKKIDCGRINEAKRLLGLKESTSLEEIKESYHRFVRKNHPDIDPANGEMKEEFEEVTGAYKLLSCCYQTGDISFSDKKKNDLIMVEIIRPQGREHE